MRNADLYVPARWRLRAVSIGAGCLIATGLSVGVASAATPPAPPAPPAPKAAPAPPPPPAPKPAPAPKEAPAPKDAPKPPPPPPPSKEDKAQQDADKQAADQAAKDAKAQQDANKKAQEAQDKAAKQAADQAAKDAKAQQDAEKKAAEEAKKHPQPTPPQDAPGPADNGNSNGVGPGSNPGQGNAGGVFVPPGQSGDVPVDNGNNGGNGNHGVGNNGGNGNHGVGNNGGNGNHGQGNNGQAVGHHQDGSATSVLGDVLSAPSVGPENWVPFGSADPSSMSPLAVLLLGQASPLATSGSTSGSGIADGLTHVLGEKFEAPTVQPSAAAIMHAFDKKTKAPRVKARPAKFTGTALSSSSWRSAGQAVPLLALLLLVEMLILGKRFGSKVRRSRPAAATVEPTMQGQVRWV